MTEQAEITQNTATTGISDEVLMRKSAESHFEVIGGRLQEVEMAAGIQHAFIRDNIYDILRIFVRDNKLGKVINDSLTYVLARDENGKITESRLPDVSFIRPGRIPADYDRSQPFPGAPDLAVEVVSPFERTATTLAKITDLLQYGAEEVWVIYPLEQELHRYANDEAPRVYSVDDTLQADNLFPGLQLKLADLYHDDYV